MSKRKKHNERSVAKSLTEQYTDRTFIPSPNSGRYRLLERKKIEFHRNGVGGAPFHVITFIDLETQAEMVGIVFEERYYTAVFEMEKLGKGIIEFGVNSFRGDVFDEPLRKMVADYTRKMI